MLRKSRFLPIKAESTSCDSCFMELRCWPESQPRSGVVPVEREPTLPSGAGLWRHGDHFDGLAIVRSGAVKVFEVDSAGEERVVQFAFAGDLLGLEALATGTHDNSAVALSETMVCKMAWPPTEEAAAHAGGLQHRLLQRASTLLRQRSHATRLADPDASVRCFLQEMAVRIGREERYGDHACVRLRLPMSRLEIGQYLGYAEETVCRSMRRLQRQGELEVSGRTLMLSNLGSVPAKAPLAAPAGTRSATTAATART